MYTLIDVMRTVTSTSSNHVKEHDEDDVTDIDIHINVFVLFYFCSFS
jgi:hypothetical protein